MGTTMLYLMVSSFPEMAQHIRTANMLAPVYDLKELTGLVGLQPVSLALRFLDAQSRRRSSRRFLFEKRRRFLVILFLFPAGFGTATSSSQLHPSSSRRRLFSDRGCGGGCGSGSGRASERPS